MAAFFVIETCSETSFRAGDRCLLNGAVMLANVIPFRDRVVAIVVVLMV